jgi:hypothetical protein
VTVWWYHRLMPYLIDGNNLLHAALEAGDDLGRLSLCEMLARNLPDREDVHIVFDGPRPPAGLARQIAATGLTVTYSPDAPADDLICREIRRTSAPRRLRVVSTDREIRRAARSRRCLGTTSEAFLASLVRRPAPDPSPPEEPPEKREGLPEGRSEDWMRAFGLDPDKK